MVPALNSGLAKYIQLNKYIMFVFRREQRMNYLNVEDKIKIFSVRFIIRVKQKIFFLVANICCHQFFNALKLLVWQIYF
jgi:hypothetical protein